MKKAIVSVLGEDKVGIISKVSTTLAELNININDISQTILGGCFTMVMIVDVENANASFTEISAKLTELGEKIGVTTSIQLETIFNAMHTL